MKHDVQAIFDESRNGANQLFRHPLTRRLIYSDGVKEVAEKAGAYWLLDIIGTELVPAYIGLLPDVSMAVINVHVENDGAIITLDVEDDAPPAYMKTINYTDFPAGDWKFYMASDDGHSCTLILPSEY